MKQKTSMALVAVQKSIRNCQGAKPESINISKEV